MKFVLVIDANATEHILYRQGISRMKHIDVTRLWLQDEVRFNILKVSVGQQSRGMRKPSDTSTRRAVNERRKTSELHKWGSDHAQKGCLQACERSNGAPNREDFTTTR